MNLKSFRKKINLYIKLNIVSICFLLMLLFLFGCSYSGKNSENENVMEDKTDTFEETEMDISTDEETVSENVYYDNNLQDIETESINELVTECVPFEADRALNYCEKPVCRYNKKTESVDVTIEFKEIPESDDDFVYLSCARLYEDDNLSDGKTFVAKAMKQDTVTVSIPYKTEYLFTRFIPVIVHEKEFYPLSQGQYITNPEDIASNIEPYPEIDSKKGLLLDPLTIEKDELNDLNVKRLVFNIPLSYIMGESDNEVYPTINYEYDDKTYFFDGFMLAGFDNLFKYLTDNNYHVTAIVLNDWNKDYPEIMHPLSRRKTGKSMYYAFNTEEEDGVKVMEAAALFLAERYSGGEYGLIQDWVIANEINQQKIWNYMSTGDINLYITSFEKSFRVFYNAIKSRYSNARVYFSIDHEWNSNRGLDYQFFNGKDVLDLFSKKAKEGGDYDWSLSIHPYPEPLTKTRFWNGYVNKTENAKIVSPMNMTVITDYMQKEEFLDTKGNVRNIGVTELGFSSKSGEKTQAAAFAYCYYIINDNPYINSFLFNRQTDSNDSLKSGLALGLYNKDYSPKYIVNVFANVDREEGNEYIEEMLSIIGANSLEEALERAK